MPETINVPRNPRERERKGFEKSLIVGLVLCAAATASVAALNPPGSETKSPRFDAHASPIVRGTIIDQLQAELTHLPPTDINVDSLRRTLTRLDYDIELVRAGEQAVPRVFVAALPNDLGSIRAPSLRKDIFFSMVLPLVLRTNAEILSDRARLTALGERKRAGQRLAAEDRLWLAAMAERYGVGRTALDELARRIDIIPPSLALAQAAEESGWGTSRFAHEGNALFGQRTYTVDDEGLLPSERNADESFRVRAFSSLIDAVRAYARNLNTHEAYGDFRKERARRRDEGESLDGHELARTLSRYSERGTAYVHSIQRIIRANRLTNFDKARLGERRTVVAAKPVI